jgi:hypothetical protein
VEKGGNDITVKMTVPRNTPSAGSAAGYFIKTVGLGAYGSGGEISAAMDSPTFNDRLCTLKTEGRDCRRSDFSQALIGASDGLVA